MPRRKNEEIENEEYRITAELMRKVVGDREYKEAAAAAGVSLTTLSNICRGHVKPSPKVVQKMTDPSARPQNNITYDYFMYKAGYTKIRTDYLVTMEGGEEVSVECMKDSNAINTLKRLQTYAQFIKAFEKRNEMLKQTICISCIKKRVGVLGEKDIAIGPFINDITLLDIQVVESSIQKWYLIFQHKLGGAVSEDDAVNSMLLSMFKLHIDEKTKVSFVCTDEAVSKKINPDSDFPIRGECSIIEVDEQKGIIKLETYISNYIYGNHENEIILV